MREIKFRAWDKRINTWYRNGDGFALSWDATEIFDDGDTLEKVKENIVFQQYTGLKDKNGKDIYEGDIIKIFEPYRTFQTHTGDNIPNGSYTEPMEPGIKEIIGRVVFENGMFLLESENTNRDWPLSWYIHYWDLEQIKDAIDIDTQTKGPLDWFASKDDGDLYYLIDIAKVKDTNGLIEMLNGAEVIGNIYQNPELL